MAAVLKMLEAVMIAVAFGEAGDFQGARRVLSEARVGSGPRLPWRDRRAPRGR